MKGSVEISFNEEKEGLFKLSDAVIFFLPLVWLWVLAHMPLFTSLSKSIGVDLLHGY